MTCANFSTPKVYPVMGRGNWAHKEQVSDFVEQCRISAVNKGASLVMQGTGHGMEGRNRISLIGYGHGGWIEQELAAGLLFADMLRVPVG